MYRFVDVCGVLIVLLFLASHPVAAQGATGVQFVVLNGQNQPVAGLTLTVIASDTTTHRLLTDAKGAVPVLALPGTFFRITAAVQADGRTVAVEGTTLDLGMRLGLIPNATRTVLLRLDANLLFVDPEAIFAGTDAPLTLATTEALTQATMAPASAATTGVSVAIGSAPVTQGLPAPVSRFGWLRTTIIVMMGLLIGVPLLVLGLRAVVNARQQPRRPR